MNALSNKQYNSILIALRELPNSQDQAELLNQTEIDLLCNILKLETTTETRMNIQIKDHKVDHLFSKIKSLLNSQFIVIDYDLNFGPDEEPPTYVTLYDGTTAKATVSVSEKPSAPYLQLATFDQLMCA